MDTIRTKNIYDTEDLKRANRNAGKYFFSPDTMRFFRSRVLNYIRHVDNCIVFIVSDKKCFNDPTRVYSVRVMNPDGSIDPIKLSFDSAKKARTAAEHFTLPLEENKKGVS